MSSVVRTILVKVCEGWFTGLRAKGAVDLTVAYPVSLHPAILEGISDTQILGCFRDGLTGSRQRHQVGTELIGVLMQRVQRLPCWPHLNTESGNKPCSRSPCQSNRQQSRHSDVDCAHGLPIVKPEGRY